MDAQRDDLLPKALTRFEQLLGPAYPDNPVRELIRGDCPPLERGFRVQRKAADWFPRLLDRYGLERTVDAALAAHAAGGVVQLAATWNGYDLALLDRVVDLSAAAPRPVVIDVDALGGEMDTRWPGPWRPSNLPAAILPDGRVAVGADAVAAALGVDAARPHHARRPAA